jgi:hypothetical protein
MPDRVDTSIKPVQALGFDCTTDCAVGVAQILELPVRNDTVLLPG